MPTVESAISSRLDADRRDLLDLSLRNPLLNYRPRARGLEIVGESPEQLYRALVRDGKRMTFLPAPEVAPTGAVDDLGATVKPVANTTGLKLQTALALDALQTRRLGILYAARTALEEQGVKTLFLALGMFRWAQPDDRAGVAGAKRVLRAHAPGVAARSPEPMAWGMRSFQSLCPSPPAVDAREKSRSVGNTL